jgi:hypothetical protein
MTMTKEERGMRLKNGLAIVDTNEYDGPVDEHPEVVEARRRRDNAATALAAATKRVHELHAIISPPKRRIETSKAMTVMAFTAGTGFGPREHVETIERWEQPEPDPHASRRARLEMPMAELAALDGRDALDAAERALADTRRAVWESRLPASDERVRSAIADFAKDLERVCGKSRLILAVLDEENRKLGGDPVHGRPRYIAAEIAFPPLVSSDPRSGSLAQFWRERVTAAGWLE